MLAVLFLPFALQAQNSWTVADGTTTHANVPLDFYNCDGSGVRNAQMLYPASLLTDMNGSTIGSITFYHQSTSTKTLTASTWYILMGTTTEADLSEGFSTVALDTVYSGDLVVTNGVFSFELTTPYTYNGGNLIVEIYTTGASGNWFGSSNQGCYGVDEIGSTYSSMSTPNYTAFLPKTTFTEVPSCFPVTNLTVNGTTTNSISLSWTDDINTGITYTVYDMADSSVIESGISGNTYTVNGLTTATGYTFGVEANCSSTDASALVTVSGVTACDANTTFPWTEDFESFDASSSGVTLNAPCWVNEHIAGSGTKLFEVYSSTTATGGNSTKKLRLPDMSSGTMTKLVLPLMDIPTGANYMFSIDVYRNASGSSYTTEGVRVYASTDGQIEGATELGFLYRNYTQTDGGVVTAETASDWYTYSFTIPFSGNGYIILKGESKYGAATYMDNLAIAEAPACLPVTAQTVTNVTSNSVSLSWTDDANTSASYIIYNMSDTSVVSDITIDGTTAVISNLEPNTAYTFGIVADCGNGDLADIRTVSTRTECAAFAAPHTWDFEDQTSGTPYCWTKVGNGTAAVTNSSTNAHAGSYYLKFSGSTSNLILLPETQDEISTLQVRFWTRPESFTSTNCGTFSVGYVTDATNDSSFVEVANYVYSDFSAYMEKAATFAGAPTGARMAMRHNANATNWYWYVDDVTIEEAPDCLPVSALSASNVTAHEATLTWQGEASSYNVYDMSDTSFVATVNDLTYGITGLTSETSYTYGVSAICSSEESPITTVSFTTLISCPAPTALNATYNPNDPTEVTLGWTENGTATDWQIVLNGDETNIIDVNTNPYVLTNIIPDSIYTVKVRAYCDVDDQSAWSSSISIESSTKTVIGSGDATNSYLPTYCLYNYSLTQQIYTVAELGDAGLIESIDFYNNGTAERIRNLSVYIVSTPKDTFESATDWISVSAADLQFSGNVTFAPQAWTTISLNGFAYDGLNNIAIIVDDNTGSWESSMSFRVFDAPNQALRIYSDGTNYDVNAPSYSGTVMNVKNQIRLVKGDLSGCLKPSGVTVSYTGGDQAVVTWSSDATSFNIDVNGVVTNNVTSPYTLSGLSLATIYTVSLQAVCSPTSVSEWTNPINFTTDACMPVNQCTVSIYAQDSWGDGWNGNKIHIIQNGVTVATYSMASQNVSQTTIYDTFQVNVCSGIPVEFAWETGSYADETSFQILDGGNTVVFSVADGSTLTDTVFFTLNEACPSCLPATALTVDAATETSITISWTGNAASYDIYNGTTFVANVTTNTYTFNGLTAGTSYTFGVQAICSATETSGVATINVMTDCADITTLPYNEGFENGLGCWTTVNGSSDGQPWTVNNCSGLSNVNPHGGAYVASSWSWSNSAMHANAWLISPKFVLPTTVSEGLVLSWWDITNASYPDKYSVLVSTTTNDTAAFTTVVRPYGPASGSWAQRNVDLTAYAGQEIYIAFHHEDYDMNYLLVDDISLFDGTPIAPVEDSLTVIITVNDPVMGTTLPAPGTHHYAASETVELLAVPNNGYHFEGWLWELEGEVDTLDADYISLSFPAGVFMDNETMTFTALFAAGNPDSTTVTYAVNDATMGSITPAPGTYTIYVGNNITAVATPNAGYELDAWMLNFYSGTTLVESDTIFSTNDQFDNPMSFGTLPQSFVDLGVTISVTAIFAALPVSEYTVTLNTADATMGSVSPAGANLVAAGSSFTATATANAGYHFTAWMSGDLQISTANPYTFDVTGNITLTAIFEADPVEPCDAPTNVVATNVTDHSITLSWTDNADAYSWNIGWQWGGAYLAGPITISNNPYTIENLQPNTSYTIHLQSICAGVGESDWVDITVTTLGTGINDLLSNNVTLFPNPAREYVDIRIDGDMNVTALEVFDVYGKLINTVNVIDNPTRINVNGLADGMYFVRVTTDKGAVTKTFVKK